MAYIEFLGKGAELFQGGALFHFQMLDFYSVGWEQGPAVRTVRVFCGWNLAV